LPHEGECLSRPAWAKEENRMPGHPNQLIS
jgi:hypothetical protein